MGFLLAGFAVAFSVALPSGNPVSTLFLMINSGLYGFSDSLEDISYPKSSMSGMGNVLLFHTLMVLVFIINGNLLIAIMNSAYESVRITATLEVMHEKASIIQDAERFFLPTVLKRSKIDPAEMFPRWLHVLVPRSERVYKGVERSKAKAVEQGDSSSDTAGNTEHGRDSGGETKNASGGNGASTQGDRRLSLTPTASSSAAPAAAPKPAEDHDEVLEDVPSQQAMLA